MMRQFQEQMFASVNDDEDLQTLIARLDRMLVTGDITPRRAAGELLQAMSFSKGGDKI